MGVVKISWNYLPSWEVGILVSSSVLVWHWIRWKMLFVGEQQVEFFIPFVPKLGQIFAPLSQKIWRVPKKIPHTAIPPHRNSPPRNSPTPQLPHTANPPHCDSPTPRLPHTASPPHRNTGKWNFYDFFPRAKAPFTGKSIHLLSKMFSTRCSFIYPLTLRCTSTS